MQLLGLQLGITCKPTIHILYSTCTVLHRHYNLHVYTLFIMQLSQYSIGLEIQRYNVGSIPNQKPWTCIFCNFSRSSLIQYIYIYNIPTLKFTTPYFNFYLLTTSLNAKYYYCPICTVAAVHQKILDWHMILM